MSRGDIELLGWAATAVFVGSYFFARPALLRGAQMFGALLWLAYGLLIHSTPVVVANILVFSAAAWTSFRAVPAPAPASRREVDGRVAAATVPESRS